MDKLILCCNTTYSKECFSSFFEEENEGPSIAVSLSSRFKIDNVTTIVLKDILSRFCVKGKLLTEILKQKWIPFHLKKKLTEMNV